MKKMTGLPLRYLTDSPYFDDPAPTGTDEDYAAARAPVPEGWSRAADAEWVNLMPPDVADMPPQGWKIHVSATLDNAERVLSIVQRYCVEAGLPHKFIRSPRALLARNSKESDRSGSGKYITIYPWDERSLEQTLDHLGDELDGESGPYILSDLRWRNGPLYVRYGGFLSRMVRVPSGELVHCIEDPDGRLVPDQRGPGFRPPEWVTLPGCLEDAMAARRAGTLRDFPYKVHAALHFSNGGGVYRAIDTRDGTEVVLREARPHAGLDGLGRDAVARQEAEQWALTRLEGLPSITPVLDYRRGHEHYFLVRAYAEGTPLGRLMLQRNPLLSSTSATPEQRATYTRWALAIADRIDDQVSAMHDRGVVFGDLHPGNVIVGPDDRITFIDFEAAAPAEDATQHLGALGYRAPFGYEGRDIDRFALAIIRLVLFAPLENTVSWAPEKVEQLLAYVMQQFPLPAGYAEQVRRDLGPIDHVTHLADPSPWRTPLWRVDEDRDVAVQADDVAESVLAAVEADRRDRRFPGDAAAFLVPGGGLSIAFGAAGVLWALHVTGRSIPVAEVDWLAAMADACDDLAPGLYDGRAGVAHVLAALGHTEHALAVLDDPLRLEAECLGGDLFSGRAGLGLVLLDLAARTGDSRFAEQAVDLVGRIPDPEAAPGMFERFGLLHGPSGLALLLLHVFDETGDDALLDRAERLILDDVGTWAPALADPEAVDKPHGTLMTGVGGTAMVARRFLTRRDHPAMRSAVDAVRALTAQRLALDVGVFTGMSGLILARCDLGSGPDGASTDLTGDEVLQAQVASLGLHVVQLHGRPAFLGRSNIRVSTDFGTGAAGVLVACAAATGQQVPALPLLDRATT